MSDRARNWCFTLNNWTEEQYSTITTTLDYQYLIIGKERAASGTPHLQGYVEFRLQKRFQTLKNFMPEIHWEGRRGTQKQAIEYCKKENNWTEFGIAKEQGARHDLDKVRQCAHEEGMRQVTSYYNLQQIQTAQKYLTYNEESRDWKPTVIWIHGPTGTGKSKLAREILKDTDYYTKNDGTKWWDGYDRHAGVILDDFRDSWWSLTETLSLLDRYEKRIEYKGGWRQFVPRTIIITCTLPPHNLYPNTGERIDQLIRRIDDIRHLDNDSHVSEVAG